MSFREVAVPSQGGHVFWRLLKQDKLFLLQEHKIPWLWPHRYRILMRANRREIANAGSREEIEADWEYLEERAVPEMMRMAKHPRDQGRELFDKLKEIDPAILAEIVKVMASVK